MQIYKGSAAERILKELATCGELPYRSLDILGKKHESIVRKIYRLRVNGYVKVSGVGNMRTIRLTPLGFQKIKACYGEKYIRQFTHIVGKNGLQGGEPLIWKTHRIAETMILFEGAGIKVNCTEKPELKGADERSYVDTVENKWGWFYSSREIKRKNPEEMQKVREGKMVGVCVLPSGIYSVYNIRFGKAQKLDNDDLYMREMIGRMVKPNRWKRASENEIESLGMRSIVIGRSVDAAVTLITDNLLAVQDDENRKRPETMQLSEAFRTAHFVPYDADGEAELRLIRSPDYQEVIEETMPLSVRAAKRSLHIAADGYDAGTGTYILNFFDSDLRKLKLFALGVLGTGIEQKRCIILCFGWQEPIVRAALPGAKVQTVGMPVIMDRLNA